MKKILCILDCKTKKYGYINFFEMLMDLRIYPSVRNNKYCNKNRLKEKEVIGMPCKGKKSGKGGKKK